MYQSYTTFKSYLNGPTTTCKSFLNGAKNGKHTLINPSQIRFKIVVCQDINYHSFHLRAAESPKAVSFVFEAAVVKLLSFHNSSPVNRCCVSPHHMSDPSSYKKSVHTHPIDRCAGGGG